MTPESNFSDKIRHKTLMEMKIAVKWSKPMSNGIRDRKI